MLLVVLALLVGTCYKDCSNENIKIYNLIQQKGLFVDFDQCSLDSVREQVRELVRDKNGVCYFSQAA